MLRIQSAALVGALQISVVLPSDEEFFNTLLEAGNQIQL
jgi:hypothetical protein